VSKRSFGYKLKELEGMLKGSVLWNEPMSRHTSYGIGGPARAFFFPANEDDLQMIFQTAHENNIQTYFIGSGSNLLVSDTGFDGFIISLTKHFRTLIIEGTRVLTQGGTMMGHFVKECLKKNLKGIESLVGVPGTVGGALRMNAGAYGFEISNFLESVTVLTSAGEKKQYKKEDLTFSYRYSSLPNDEVILSAKFEFEKGHEEEIQALRAQASKKRKSTQPLRFRSAGSVFKNPPDAKPAGYLIEKAGVKGIRHGDAEISPKHANFILNHGKSSSEDIAWLIRLARKAVQEKFGVELELEIKTVGFPPDHFKTQVTNPVENIN